MSRFHITKLLLVGALLELALASTARAEETVVPPPAPRKPAAEAGIVLVPYGLNYLRAGAGASFRYDIPLVQQPGLLWDSTMLSFGVRDFFGFVNNNLSAFVEVVPIAFFKLQVAAGWDTLFVAPLSGGVRVLTPEGEQRLAGGQVQRDNLQTVDWVNGQDNRANFYAPVDGQGLRVKVTPTLQAALGPVAAQYNFTWDYNAYTAADHGPDAVFHDSFTFTLRKMRDVGLVHELVLVYQMPVPGDFKLGLNGKHYSILGTGLQSQNVSLFGFYKPAWGWVDGRLKPWVVGQADSIEWSVKQASPLEQQRAAARAREDERQHVVVAAAVDGAGQSAS